MTKPVLRSLVIALAFCALPSASFADTVYTDTTFATASYPEAFTPYVNNVVGTTTIATGPVQDVDGGPGGTTNALETIFQMSGTGDLNTIIDVGVINSAFTYDPSTQGALWTVSGSIEALQGNSNGGYPPDPFWYVLIEQGGNFYYAFAAQDSNTAGFQLLTAPDLVASNFWLFNPATGATTTSSHPDFSSAGATMEFGLFMISGALAAPANNQSMLYSNLTLDLAPAPEPASLLMVGGSLAGLALLRRRRVR